MNLRRFEDAVASKHFFNFYLRSGGLRVGHDGKSFEVYFYNDTKWTLPNGMLDLVKKPK